MANIHLLDSITIDQIAAGEVIERPSSIVKELVENAIDAKASRIEVEIEDGGSRLIKITDNGCGIAREDVETAFFRHATSKIQKVEDLNSLHTLGFRGEALSSIAAVAKVTLITKQKEAELGSLYRIEGGQAQTLQDTSCQNGTTFEVRSLFYNVPARQKFLKSATTESNYIQELLQRLALSHPDIAFTFRNQGREKFSSNGNGKLKDCIYAIFGRETANALIAIDFALPLKERKGNMIPLNETRETDHKADLLHVKGFLGKPELNRGNRNYEIFFINQRYIKNSLISKAVEDAYRGYVMQHKFPFAILSIDLDPHLVDVNVHPGKMEVRFQNHQEIYSLIYESVHRTLLEPELIPEASLSQNIIQVEAAQQISLQNKVIQEGDAEGTQKSEIIRESPFLLRSKSAKISINGHFASRNPSTISKASQPENLQTIDTSAAQKSNVVQDQNYFLSAMRDRVKQHHKNEQTMRAPSVSNLASDTPDGSSTTESRSTLDHTETGPPTQEELPFLKTSEKPQYRLIGQVFETYWMIAYEQSLYIIDQHAAHEKVLYERMMKDLKERVHSSQQISPPILIKLQANEQSFLEENRSHFERLGYAFDSFGDDEYAISAVPGNLFSIAKKELLLELIDQLSDQGVGKLNAESIDAKIASMSCKAAVKGNYRLKEVEVEALISDLLELENPYFCPHGRPTLIRFSKQELEKKFKRIV